MGTCKHTCVTWEIVPGRERHGSLPQLLSLGTLSSLLPCEGEPCSVGCAPTLRLTEQAVFAGVRGCVMRSVFVPWLCIPFCPLSVLMSTFVSYRRLSCAKRIPQICNISSQMGAHFLLRKHIGTLSWLMAASSCYCHLVATLSEGPSTTCPWLVEERGRAPSR